MYTIVFLLVFSVIFAMPVSTHTIVVDVYKTSETVDCYSTENKVTLDERESIDFEIQVSLDFKSLLDSWCYKDSATIYREKLFSKNVNPSQIWKTNGKTCDRSMAGMWNCWFVVEPFDPKVGSYSEHYRAHTVRANCMIEVAIKQFTADTTKPPPTDPPHHTDSPLTTYNTIDAASTGSVDVSVDYERLSTDTKKIQLDIYFTENRGDICQVPENPIYVTPGQTMQFIIHTPADLDSFICNNEYYQGNYKRQFIDDSNVRQRWETEEIVIQPEMAGKLTCKYVLKNPNREGKCELELTKYASNRTGRVINNNQRKQSPTPSPISLNIVELRQWSWENKYHRNKIYDYTFTEGDAMLTCQLDNPTNNEEVYRFTYYLDGKLVNRSLDVTVTKQKSKYFGHRFKLRKGNKLILCSAEAVKGTKVAPALTNTINLQYVPPPALTIRGSKNLKNPEYFPQNWTEKYDYYFEDGEKVSLECAMTDAVKNYNKNYRLSFYITEETSTVDTTRSVEASYTARKEEFALKKEHNFIKCVAENTGTNSNLPKQLTSIVYLHHTAPENVGPLLIIRGSPKLVKEAYFPQNRTQLYSYNFSEEEKVSLECALSDAGKQYKNHVIRFCVSEKVDACPSTNFRGETPTSYSQTFTLKKEHKIIHCTATDYRKKPDMPKYMYSRVFLNYRPVHTKTTGLSETCASVSTRPIRRLPVKLSIEGVPDEYKQHGTCKTDEDNTVKTCSYNFTKEATLNLTCAFSGGLDDNHYRIEFGKDTCTFEGGQKTSKSTKSETFTIKQRNRNIVCTVKNIDDEYAMQHEYNIQFKYISPSSLPMKNPKPIGRPEESTETSILNPGYLNSTAFPWKWVAAACAAIFTLFFVICCTVIFCRHKKLPPSESNYANLTRDQNNYQSMPKPAPRTLKPASQANQKPCGGQKPDLGQRPPVGQKPKAALETVYRDPKDSQDMSEALYAEPNRFIGESDNYAVPYGKSDNYAQPYKKSDNYAQPYEKSDNYTEPYVASSEGSYAEIQVKPDLYATPIPKAQRPPKVKEDEYSNVFTGQYGNTKK